MFRRVLVATRGAVAARVIRALRLLNVESVAVYSDADTGAPYLGEAAQSFPIGPGPARESYLSQDAFLRVLESSGADAVHPGYGFLAENALFARRIEAAGAEFIGPASRWLEAMGHKVSESERRWGFMNVVGWNRKTGEMQAASDPRGDSGSGEVR